MSSAFTRVSSSLHAATLAAATAQAGSAASAVFPRRPHQSGAARAPVQALEPAAPPVVLLPVLALDADAIEPRLPSPTPAVVEVGSGVPLLVLPSVACPPDAPRVQVRKGDALAFVSAPTGASAFAFGSGVSSFKDAAVADANEPRLPSPTPTTPPPSPRAGARRRLLALGLPLASPSADSPTRSRGRRAGTWSPTALRLANGASKGVAPGT